MSAPTPDAELDELGALIRAARQARGLTQDELAPRLGIVQSVLSAIESGRRGTVPAALIARLVDELGLDAVTVLQAAARRSDAAVSPAA